ncbi:MAG: STM4011 family radical SAM protein [Verrucomicrobiales bacterium]
MTAPSLDRWNILYRGPLSSCNYACGYCPFAKRRNSAAELRDDARHLARFCDWVEDQRPREIGVLFTPWGEALIHRAYQQAMVRLSRMPHVYRVAIQTNLSCPLDWMREADLGALALWATFHPGEVPLDRFAGQCARLCQAGVRHSVGAVGFKEALPAIRDLRHRLDPGTYLWVNANKRDAGYYGEEDLAAFESIDPHFRLNAKRHPSLGQPCRAGHTSFTVDGSGDVRRCHFIGEVLGNLYAGEIAGDLRRRRCPNESCGCHIGYVHLEPLDLYTVFGDGVLERIPDGWGGAASGAAARRI